MFIAALFTSQEVEATQCPSTDKWIFLNVVYTYSEVLFSLIKREEILSHAITWMNLEGIKLSEIIQILYDSTYITYLKPSNSWRQKA